MYDLFTPPRPIAIDPVPTRMAGGTPAAPGTRVHVHARLAVRGLLDLCLTASASKVTVGDPIIALGFRLGAAHGRLDCPAQKRTTMIADCREQFRAATQPPFSVNRRKAARLTGRLCNLSQIYPELRQTLHGGYGVVEGGTFMAGGRMRRPPILQLAQSSTAYEAWCSLLEAGVELLDANEGVPIAPQASFPTREEPGAVTVTTDASGWDGVGGYLFDASDAHTVWLVAEEWPADVRQALARYALRKGDPSRARGPLLSMPAAELFGAWAVTEAVTQARGGAPSTVTAVGDCDATVAALNAASSGNPQMRTLIWAARRLCPQWLAVSVPRGLNTDADRLSHPSQLSARWSRWQGWGEPRVSTGGRG